MAKILTIHPMYTKHLIYTLIYTKLISLPIKKTYNFNHCLRR